MSDSYSAIWLEIGLPRQKKFLVCQQYREWQFTGQGGDHSSLTSSEQLRRWEVHLDSRERALNSGLETHKIGDLNINNIISEQFTCVKKENDVSKYCIEGLML